MSTAAFSPLCYLPQLDSAKRLEDACKKYLCDVHLDPSIVPNLDLLVDDVSSPSSFLIFSFFQNSVIFQLSSRKLAVSFVGQCLSTLEISILFRSRFCFTHFTYPFQSDIFAVHRMMFKHGCEEIERKMREESYDGKQIHNVSGKLFELFLIFF